MGGGRNALSPEMANHCPLSRHAGWHPSKNNIFSSVLGVVSGWNLTGRDTCTASTCMFCLAGLGPTTAK